MATYQADHVGFARLMLSREIGNLVERRAQEIAAVMRAEAPRQTGLYASNFTVQTGLDVVHQTRRAAYVVNDTRYATALEVGSWSIRNPPKPMTGVLQQLAVA